MKKINKFQIKIKIIQNQLIKSQLDSLKFEVYKTDYSKHFVNQMDKKMHTHKSQRDLQSRAINYMPSSSNIRQDGIYEPVQSLNALAERVSDQWDLHKGQNHIQTQNMGGTYPIRQYNTPMQISQQNQKYQDGGAMPFDFYKRQGAGAISEKTSHSYNKASTDFQSQQNFSNPYIMRQMKASQEAVTSLEKEIDAVHVDRGLVSNFARKMQQSSGNDVNPLLQSQGGIQTMVQQLTQSKSGNGGFIQSNDLKQLREQRAAFKEYEQKYFGGSGAETVHQRHNASNYHNSNEGNFTQMRKTNRTYREPTSTQLYNSRQMLQARELSKLQNKWDHTIQENMVEQEMGAIQQQMELIKAMGAPNYIPDQDEIQLDDELESSRPQQMPRQSYTEHSPRRVTRGVMFQQADEEHKEEHDEDEEEMGQQIIENNGDFNSPERPRRNIQEQQTCWRQRNASIDVQDNEQEMQSPEQPDGMRRTMDQRGDTRRHGNQDLASSPDPMQIPTQFFQSPDKRGKYVDQNPESPPRIQLQDQRRIRHSNIETNGAHQLQVSLKNQIDQQMPGNTVISPYDQHKTVLTLQQQNNTEPQGPRKSHSLVRGSSKHATRSTTINEIDQIESKVVMIPEVYMRCVTWTRDSNGLFDYESKNISKKNIKTQTGGRVIRIGEEVQLVSKSQKFESLAFHDADTDQTIDPQRMVVIERCKGGSGNFIIRNDTCKKVEEVEEQHSKNPDHLPQNMFIVVRNTKSTLNNQDYRLFRGDTIKLGRIKFKVKDIFCGANELLSKKKDQSPKSLDEGDSECSSEDEDQAFKTIDIDCTQASARSKLSKQLNQQKAPEVPDTQRDEDKANRQCKFCWMAESTEENPLLSACQCDGSMRFIHFSCLKHWIMEKMQRKEIEIPGIGKIFTYNWKQFECEICKHAYPLTFKSRVNDKPLVYGIVKDIIQPDMPKQDDPSVEKTPFLLIQSLPFEKTSGRVVHLIIPDRTVPQLEPLEQPPESEAPDQRHIKVFKMGRGHESSVRICDISVSRCHTLIKFDPIKSQFQLEDNLSKFGTLVLPKQKDIELEANCTKAVQIGRSVISFTVKEVEKIIQAQINKTMSQSPVRYAAQNTASKDLELLIKNSHNSQPGLKKVKSIDLPSAKIVEEKIDKTRNLQQDPEVSAFDSEQQMELLLKQKIHETNKKIEQLMKCESKYIEQLKQGISEQSNENEESVEDAILKAANRLIQAKFQLDKLDEQSQQIVEKNQQQQLTILKPSEMEIQDTGKQAHKMSLSHTADKKSNNVSSQMQNNQSKTEQKAQRKITSVFSALKSELSQDNHTAAISKNRNKSAIKSTIQEREPKSSQEQIDEIIQKFSPGRASTAGLQKNQGRSTMVVTEGGISPYHKNEQRKVQQYSHSKVSLKKERPDHSHKKHAQEQQQILVEDYRVASQIAKKNAAKSPSPKRVKVGRNTSPFVVQTHKPIKTSKVAKTISKNQYNHEAHVFSDQKLQNTRYLNQSPLHNNGGFRVFNPNEDHDLNRSPDRQGMIPVSNTISRDQNPFRIDSYDFKDLSGSHTYSQAKVNNYISSGSQPSSAFKNEFKDSHYRQSLTGSKINANPSTSAGRYGQSYTEMYEAKKLRDTGAKINPMQSSYQPTTTSAFNQYAAISGQSRFYNNYIGNGLVSGAETMNSAAQHSRLNPGSRYNQAAQSQIYPGSANSNISNSYGKLNGAGYGQQSSQSRYNATSGHSQSYKRPYY